MNKVSYADLAYIEQTAHRGYHATGFWCEADHTKESVVSSSE